MQIEEALTLLYGPEDEKGERGEENYKTINISRNDAYIRIIQILGKYNDDVISAAEHDTVWFGSFDETMPEEEIKELAGLGLMLDEECEGWSKFV